MARYKVFVSHEADDDYEDMRRKISLRKGEGWNVEFRQLNKIISAAHEQNRLEDFFELVEPAKKIYLRKRFNGHDIYFRVVGRNIEILRVVPLG